MNAFQGCPASTHFPLQLVRSCYLAIHPLAEYPIYFYSHLAVRLQGPAWRLKSILRLYKSQYLGRRRSGSASHQALYFLSPAAVACVLQSNFFTILANKSLKRILTRFLKRRLQQWRKRSSSPRAVH